MKRMKWKKILVSSLVLIIILLISIIGISILTENVRKNNVKIQFSNNHEVKVLTSKTKVSDILAENNIILASNETVWPSLDSDITDEKIIKITLIGAEASAVSEKDINKGVNAKANEMESTMTLMEAVPFEIITDDISDGAQNTTSTIAQHGRIGLKEVTYKVTYKNDVEVDREEIESKITRKPVDHIIQIQAITTASASINKKVNMTALLPDQYVVTAYCACEKCCDKTDGITASGTKALANHTIAASPIFDFGTQIRINGIVYTVEDRGGAIQGNRLDIYMDTHEEAIRLGSKSIKY